MSFGVSHCQPEERCESSECGNGTVDDGEGCDDGNRVTEVCGIGVSRGGAPRTAQSNLVPSIFVATVKLMMGKPVMMATDSPTTANMVREAVLSRGADCTEAPWAAHFCGDGVVDGAERRMR